MTKLIVALLFVIIWTLPGCERSGSVQAVNASNARQLEIRPPEPMRDTLEVPVGEQLVDLYRCDFAASNLTSVRLRLVGIRDHQVVELGHVTAGTPEASVPGTFYVACPKNGGDDEIVCRMLSFGISARSSRRSALIKDFVIRKPYGLKIMSWPLRDITVSPDKDVAIWGICYRKKVANERTKTVQELVSDNGPFISQDPQKIIEEPKSMDDSVVVIAIACGIE